MNPYESGQLSHLDEQEIVSGMNRYIAKVYRWMFLGLLVTALVATAFARNPSLVSGFRNNPILFYGAMIAELGLVMALSAAIYKLSFQAAAAIFGIYAALNGVTLSFILLIYTGASVSSTFFVAAAMFGVMSLYGYVTKTDLTKFRNILMMGLIGVLILSVVNIFLGSSPLAWIISLVGVVVFLGLTAYDMQKLKAVYFATANDEVMQNKLGLLGALSLYLDFINLFLMLLRLLGRRR